MITVDRLTFGYKHAQSIFEDFSWEVGVGEAWAILGPSGCGKTTLLYLLAGLRHPTAGQISINEQLIRRPRPETGLILQDHGLLPWTTVEKNVRLGLEIRRFYGPDGQHSPTTPSLDLEAGVKRVADWMERLGIISLRDQYPTQLSGGQRQRTAIARTLVLGPDLLLMDEPFSALDAYTREDLQNLVLDLRRENKLTAVIVTHNIEEAALLGQRILVLAHPPNTTPQIVENAQAGDPAYRETPAYAACCAELRGLMGVGA